MNRPTMRAGMVWGWVAAIVAVVAAAAMLQFDPPRAVRLPWSQTPLPELCGSQRMLGVDCPGCGLTRSFILAADGRWLQAWHMHPAGATLFACLLVLLPYRLWQGWRLARGHHPPDTTLPEMLTLSALAATHLVWWMANTIIRHAA